MSKTLTVSDDVYDRLEREAQVRGLSVELLIEEWERNESELARRKNVVRGIDSLRERVFSRYGEMPDSSDLIRDNRAR